MKTIIQYLSWFLLRALWLDQQDLQNQTRWISWVCKSQLICWSWAWTPGAVPNSPSTVQILSTIHTILPGRFINLSLTTATGEWLERRSPGLSVAQLSIQLAHWSLGPWQLLWSIGWLVDAWSTSSGLCNWREQTKGHYGSFTFILCFFDYVMLILLICRSIFQTCSTGSQRNKGQILYH